MSSLLYSLLLLGPVRSDVTQEVNRQHVITEAQVQFQTSPSGICGGQCGTMTGVSPSAVVFPSVLFLYLSPMLYNLGS